MFLIESCLIGISLAMDAFAICLCQGLVVKEKKMILTLKLGGTFGVFQFIMPILGFYIGNIFNNKISTYGNIIAFIILVLIGINMVRDGGDEECKEITSLKGLLVLGIATSIDALAIGLSLAMNGKDRITLISLIIGLITFIISILGVIFGNSLGKIIGNKAHYLGGSILILLGIKALLSDM